MVFPRTQIDLCAEAFVNSAWTDIAPYVRGKPVTITRGRANEQAAISPSKAQFLLNNRFGQFSPRNPNGTYYGSLGRNTPIRIAIRRERDTFTRVVSNGWGTATSGEAWSVTGSAGFAASDFAVNGTAGTHSVPATVAHRLTYLGASSYRDVRVGVTFSVQSVTDVTGAEIEPGNLVVRGLSNADYYMVRITIDASENVKIALMHFSGTVYAAAVTALTGWAGEALRVECLVEGHWMRGKVWRASDPEPYGWQVSAPIDVKIAPYAGWVGVRSGIASGNTNSKPITFVYDDFEVRLPRFAGEVSSWPQRWDPSGHDKHVPVEANGLLRRLGQGANPQSSTLYRGLTTTTPTPLGYWPCEEGRNAVSIASAIPGGTPMRVDGPANFAANSEFACSAPLPELRKSAWTGDIPTYTATGNIQTRFLLKVPDTGTVDLDVICRTFTNGTIRFWDIMYHTGGLLSIHGYAVNGAEVVNSTPLGFAINGMPLRMQLDLEQIGSDIRWTIAILRVGSDLGFFLNGTASSHTLGSATQVVTNPYKNIDNVAMGHISVHSVVTSLFALNDQLKAYDGERSGLRMKRLCAENSVDFSHQGDLARTMPMGPQTVDTLPNLLRECEDADLGTLSEPRGAMGLVYRTRETLYNQAPALAVGYGDLAPPLEPVDDDQLTRNDVIATRKNGSSYRAIETTGRLSVLPPEQGGVGRYDTNVTVNVQRDDVLPDVAGWIKHLGTVDWPRYPTIEIKLAGRAFASSVPLMSQALALSVDDRLTVSDPPAGQAPDLITQLARGLAERIMPWEHKITVNTAPETPWQVLELDNALCRLAPAADCRLDDSYSDVATSLDVLPGSGPLWTTDPAQMPIGIWVNGEEMSVSAISNNVPSFVNVGTAAHADNASVSPGIPASIAAGDLLLLYAVNRNFSATVNVPSGYTSLLELANIRIMGKIAGVSESPPSVTFNSSTSGDTCSAQIAAFRNVPLGLLNFSQQFNGSSQNIAFPALNDVVAGGLVVYLGWKQDDWTSVATLPGATEIAEPASTLGSDQGLVWDYQIFQSDVLVPANSFAVTGGTAQNGRGMVLLFGRRHQTFTVVRSVNGVVKAQGEGARVFLAREPYLAL